MKQGEYWHNEQGAGIEVDVPGCQVSVRQVPHLTSRSKWVGETDFLSVCSRGVGTDSPSSIKNLNLLIKRETRKLTQVHLQFIAKPSAAEDNFYGGLFSFPLGVTLNVTNPKIGRKKGREFEKETEGRLPAASCLMYGCEPHDESKG